MREKIIEHIGDRLLLKGDHGIFVKAKYYLNGSVDKLAECEEATKTKGKINGLYFETVINGTSIRFPVYESAKHDAFEIGLSLGA